MDTDAIKVAQARVARLQAAFDNLPTGRLRSGLEASTGADSNPVGYFKPDPDALHAELARTQADLDRLRGDSSSMRRALTLREAARKGVLPSSSTRVGSLRSGRSPATRLLRPLPAGLNCATKFELWVG